MVERNSSRKQLAKKKTGDTWITSAAKHKKNDEKLKGALDGCCYNLFIYTHTAAYSSKKFVEGSLKSDL